MEITEDCGLGQKDRQISDIDKADKQALDKQRRNMKNVWKAADAVEDEIDWEENKDYDAEAEDGNMSNISGSNSSGEESSG